MTITQVQALRAARNAGIAVPQDAIKMAQKYLQDSTNGSGRRDLQSRRGGGGGDGRPALTAAAIACGFSFGDYNSPLVKKWFKFCQQTPARSRRRPRIGHDEYTHYYYAQAIYILGDDGYAKLFPDSKAERPPDLERLQEGQLRQPDPLAGQRRQLVRRPRRPRLHHRRST